MPPRALTGEVSSGRTIRYSHSRYGAGPLSGSFQACSFSVLLIPCLLVDRIMSRVNDSPSPVPRVGGMAVLYEWHVSSCKSTSIPLIICKFIRTSLRTPCNHMQPGSDPPNPRVCQTGGKKCVGVWGARLLIADEPSYSLAALRSLAEGVFSEAA